MNTFPTRWIDVSPVSPVADEAAARQASARVAVATGTNLVCRPSPVVVSRTDTESVMGPGPPPRRLAAGSTLHRVDPYFFDGDTLSSATLQPSDV